MENYSYQQKLREIWELAVQKYRDGNRDSSTYFVDQNLEFVDAIGATPQEIYDFAEDYVNGGDPDFTTFALLADIRRHYFLNKQDGKRSLRILDPSTLPAKTDSVRGIEWLPRIIPKAKAKIRGELNPDIMFGCGGDRKFFRTHDIHPAEFLRIVEENEDNDEAIIDWVSQRSRAVSAG